MTPPSISPRFGSSNLPSARQGDRSSEERLLRAVTGRSSSMFEDAYSATRKSLAALAGDGSILVAGAAGSIGSAVVELLHEVPSASLTLADANENGLTDLIRSLHASGRSRRDIEVRPVLLDITAPWLRYPCETLGNVATVMNFAAVKHVRSERDVPSLLRMFSVNVQGTMLLMAQLARRRKEGRFFTVSSDKAADPTSLMGASKRLMELAAFSQEVDTVRVSTCRFANVAYSAGSLLESWLQRIDRRQALGCPAGIRRFFISPREAAQLCVISLIHGENQILSLIHI